MVGFNSSQTPIDTESKLGDDGDPYNKFVFICMILRGLISRLLRGFCDADWDGCPTTRRSTLEAEYRGVANAAVETCWLRNLLRELHIPLSSDTLVYCDNMSAVYQGRS
ncbi:ribonuclease H-like domain-containing protein [Tanacetum coccineum]